MKLEMSRLEIFDLKILAGMEVYNDRYWKPGILNIVLAQKPKGSIPMRGRWIYVHLKSYEN